MPVLVVEYVTRNYSGQFIRGWQINDATQVVKLSSATELEFDKNGNFLRVKS
jgi:hypothetical protein